MTGTLIWKYGTGGPVEASPAVVNGVVYFSAGSVYALNAVSGALIWKYTTEADAYSAPAVANGVVYIGVTYAGNPNAPPGLYALNANTGARLWAFYVDGVMPGDGCSDTTVANGLAYIGCYSYYEGSAVYAFDIATQLIVWQGGFGGQTPVVANGVAYVGSYALNASTGAVLWNWPERAFIRRWWPTAWCTPVPATILTRSICRVSKCRSSSARPSVPTRLG